MNILICYWGFPLPVVDGQDLRIYEIFRCIAKEHNLFLWSFLGERSETCDSCIEQAKSIFRELFIKRVQRKALGYLASYLLPAHASAIEFPITRRRIYKELTRFCKEKKIDVMYVNGFPANIILAEFRGVPKLLDLCDSIALMSRKSALNGPQGLRRFYSFARYLRAKRIERYVVFGYEMTTLVSEQDAEFERKLCPNTKVLVIPNGVNTSYFHPMDGIAEEKNSILFFGNMDYPPNIDAVSYFCADILPQVKQKAPEVKFYVVGRNPTQNVLDLQDKNIIVTGSVQDIRPYIARSNVVVAPMRIGTGVKNKILEALAMGKPVVTSPVALGGLSKEVKTHLVVADSSQRFAEKIVAFLEDPGSARKIGKEGRVLVAMHHSWQKAASQYENRFRMLTNNVINQ